MKTKWCLLRVWAIWILAIESVVLAYPAAASTPKAPSAEKADAGAAVRLGDEELFSLPTGAKGANARATAASRVLDAAVHRGETKVVSRFSDGAARISVGNVLLVELNQADAEAAGHRELKSYSEVTARRVGAALAKEKTRRTIANRVLSVSSVVFLAFVAWLLIGFVGRTAKRIVSRIDRDPKAVGAISIGELELLPAAAARDALRLFVFGSLWLVRLGLFYFWVLAALSFFDSTRPLASRATGFLFAPALDLLGQLVARLPLLVALSLTFAAVILLMRFVTLYCAAIERGEIQSAWIRPETARTSGTLLVAGLCLGALLFVSPLFAGNADGSLPRIGLLLVGAIAVGATPYLGSCLLGIRAVYENAWRPGDRIDYGGQTGRVERLGLYDATLRADDGAQLRVPHLMSLWHPTRIYPREGGRGSFAPEQQGTRALNRPAQQSLSAGEAPPSVPSQGEKGTSEEDVTH